MLSSRCTQRNRGIIPKLLSDHGALLSKDATVVDLSTAENWFVMNKLRDDLTGTLWSDSDLGYSEGIGGSSKVRQLLADVANEHFNPSVRIEKSHVVLGAGGCFALDALVEQICDPGEGILIAAPYWPGLDLSISVRSGAVALPVQVPLESFFDVTSIRYHEEALAAAKVPVKAILICNPHNPLGKNYPRETLEAMLDFCSSRNLHLISDEVYALSQHTHGDNPTSDAGFISALSLDTTRHRKGLVHVLYSLSKDFGCNGVRIGAFISPQNQDICLSGALSVNCQTSTIANLISEKVVLSKSNVKYVTTSSQEWLKQAYQRIEEFLRQKQVEFVPATCGIYIFAKLCDVSTLEAQAEYRRILREHAVILSAGTDYHFDEPGWFRICYACHPDKLTDGLKRIGECIDEFREARPN